MASTTGLKRIVLFFDLLCALLALVLLSFGIYLVCNYGSNQIGAISGYAYIGVGIATILVFLLGCFAAIRENSCCTITFIILVIVVIIAQAAVIGIITVMPQQVSSNMANVLDNTWEEELKHPGAMSIYESWLECCGRASPQDYIVHERLPPKTCFKDNDNTKSENLITKGCRLEFENYLIHLLLIFNILGWILIILELVRTIISCCLCNNIRNDRRRSYF